MYGEVILDHFRHPRNEGSLERPDIVHEDLNPLCGDRVRIELSIDDGVIRAARFRGDLCIIAKAASSMLTEMIAGARLDAVADLRQEELLGALHDEIPAGRRNCALLPLSVLKAGVRLFSASRP